jgi:hypothetical protein
MTASELANRLGGRKAGNQWMARCPAHDDQNPSLAIDEGKNGSWVLFCHAGCPQQKVLDALIACGILNPSVNSGKLSSSDRAKKLWNESKSGSLPISKPLQLYLQNRGLSECSIPAAIRFHQGLDYYHDNKLIGKFPALVSRVTDLNENVIAVHRIYVTAEGKKAPVPEVKKALGPILGSVVHLDAPTSSLAVAEGIETALAVRVATALPTWSAISANGLKALEIPESVQEVHIFADKDASGTGENAAKALAEKLTRKGKKVFIHLPLDPIPQGGTIDWLDVWNKNGKAAFLESMQTAPVYVVDTALNNSLPLIKLSELLAEPEVNESWVLEKVLPTSGIGLVAGKPKVGKTTLVRCLALAIARGEPFLNRSTLQGSVIYLALEEKKSEVRRHFDDLGASQDDEIYIYADIAPQDALVSLEAHIAQMRPVLVVIDPLLRFVRVRDANDYAKMTTALEPIMKLARKSGTHILCIHHTAKGERADGDSILGSQAIFGAMDSAILINRTEQNRTIKSIQRYGEDIKESILDFDPKSRMITLGGAKDDNEEQNISQAILSYLKVQIHPKLEREIDEAIEGRKQIKVRALRNLLHEGKVVRSESGGKSNPFRYAVQHSCSQVPVEIVVPDDPDTHGNKNPSAIGAGFNENRGSISWYGDPMREHGNKNNFSDLYSFENGIPKPPKYITDDQPPLSDEMPIFEGDSL